MTWGFVDCWRAGHIFGTMQSMVKAHEGRRYDLWFENPYRYHEHMRQVGECQVVLTIGQMSRTWTDALHFMRSKFSGVPWRCIVTGNESSYYFDHTAINEEDIRAVWPVWEYPKYNLPELKDYILNPWAERSADPVLSFRHHPVATQPHRVVVQGIRSGHTSMERSRRIRLTKIQRMYPEVDFFIRQQTFSSGLQFGAGFTSGSIDLKQVQVMNSGSIFLPNGQKVELLDIMQHHNARAAIDYFGYDPKEVRDDFDISVLFQLEAFRYSAHHWDDDTGLCKRPQTVNKGMKKYYEIDYSNPDMYAKAPSYSVINNFQGEKAKEDDKILCDSCSLWRVCPAYRSEAVCGLPGTESKKLSELAQSRNSDDILDMLSKIVAKQADRYEEKIRDGEGDDKNYDRDLNRLADSLFRNGTQLAKLRNPNLGRPMIQINNLGPSQQAAAIVASADPRELGAVVFAELEAKGYDRSDITEELVRQHIKDKYGQKAIEGEVVEG